MTDAPRGPAGLVYQPDFITEEEERGIADSLERMEFDEIQMRGQTARRVVRHFGYRYDYDTRDAIEGEPLPASLEWLRERAAALAELRPEELVEALITRYPPGAGIGWHRDAPRFGRVVGVSLLAPCRMRFQKGSGERRRVFELELAPRSAYVLRGEARWTWQHSIPPMKILRYSITFRSLRQG